MARGRVRRAVTILVVGTVSIAAGCAAGDERSTGGGAEASTSRPPGGYEFVRQPIVVVERVRGENRFSVWFRLDKALPAGRCNRFCQQEGLGAPWLGSVSLSGGGTDSDQAGIVGVRSRRGRHCYQQDVSDYGASSPLATARPGHPVTVRLKIKRVEPALSQRVRMIAPLPRIYDKDGFPRRLGLEYERALNCAEG